eukprot:COSAG02_NODE_14_length_56855_cov_512.793661_49_plen_48_part_00
MVTGQQERSPSGFFLLQCCCCAVAARLVVVTFTWRGWDTGVALKDGR